MGHFQFQFTTLINLVRCIYTLYANAVLVTNGRVLRGIALSVCAQNTNCYSGSFLCDSERFGHSKPYLYRVMCLGMSTYAKMQVYYLRPSFRVRLDPTSKSCLVQQNRCPFIAMYSIHLHTPSLGTDAICISLRYSPKMLFFQTQR